MRTTVASWEPADLAARVVELVGDGLADDADRLLSHAAASGVRLSAVVAAAGARPAKAPARGRRRQAAT